MEKRSLAPMFSHLDKYRVAPAKFKIHLNLICAGIGNKRTLTNNEADALNARLQFSNSLCTVEKLIVGNCTLCNCGAN